ncbi:MAG TPA: YidE/YbjL duplication [Synergistales bacterium]|nr:YidE/YbjL duplication [Synergistales bacterium]
MDFLVKLLNNQLLVLSFAVASGLLLGKVRFRNLSLGTSGALFTGLVLGLLKVKISYELFNWNLMLFVVAVGLLSAEDIVLVVKKYGMKFVVLGVIVTGVGALCTYAMAHLASGVEPLLVAGTYTGALTSSPGLGAALETTGGNPLVTVGYTLAYPFGVLAVVLFVQLAPAIFGIDVKRERQELASIYRDFYRSGEKDRSVQESIPFSVLSFVVCIVLGILLGSVTVPVLGSPVSLGSTGGGLIAALALGAFGRLGPLPMRMEKKTLTAIRELSLAYFLAVVGLMAGPQMTDALMEHGFLLVGIGAVSALAAEVAGYLLGRTVWKLNWILLAGAICGAMTSTPGLGAAIEATGGEECSAGYGATYPMAIVCMVVFTTLLAKALG